MSKRKEYLPVHIIGHAKNNQTNGVFFNPHTPNSRNAPGLTVITGYPGSGKTFLSQCLISNDVAMDKVVVAFDWKGDLSGVAANPELANKCSLVEIGRKEDAGILDPFFSTSDSSIKAERVLTLVEILMGGLDKRERSLVMPYISETMKDRKRRASMGTLIQKLMRDADTAVHSIGNTLDAISKDHIGRIMFYKGERRPRPISIGKGATIFTVLNLDLPANEDDAKNTASGRNASAVFFMMTSLVSEMLLKPDGLEKSLYIDEAWAVLQTKAGQSLVQKASLLGRSRGLALILATQNYKHFADAEIGNTISNHFAFASKTIDAKRAIRALELPGRWVETVNSLDTGECIMKDMDGRVGVMRVSEADWNDGWADWFNTNMYTNGQAAEAG